MGKLVCLSPRLLHKYCYDMHNSGWAGDRMPQSRAAQELLCNAIFRGAPKSRRVCEEILGEILNNGYVRMPRSGIKRYVVKRLVECGVLAERDVPACDSDRMLKVVELNMAWVQMVYQLLRNPRFAPLCVG